VPLFEYRLRSRGAPLSVDDYRRRARRALPEMVWDYVSGGADDMRTVRANRSAFADYTLRSHVLTGNGTPDLSTSVAGISLDLPVLLAPTGLSGLTHWQGELGAARAAERAGTRAILSTASTYSIEEVAEGTDRDHFFQLYPWSDAGSGARAMVEGFIERAATAGYAGLFVTVDVPVMGNREGELRSGLGVPPVLTPYRVARAAFKPRWWYGLLRHRRTSLRNLVDRGGAAASLESARAQYRFTRPDFSWSDLEWIRSRWDGPLFVKGITEADDAERAVGLGANGVVVSNHGGRQLDGVTPSLRALPAIAERVGGTAEVLLDGGIVRGTDVVKALSLGASAVCIGRAHLYGLATAGSAGVSGVLDIFSAEITRALVLMGVAKTTDLSADNLTYEPSA